MSPVVFYRMAPIDRTKSGNRRRLAEGCRRINGNCTHCRGPVSRFTLNRDGQAVCPGCGTPTFTLRRPHFGRLPAVPESYRLPDGITIEQVCPK